MFYKIAFNNLKKSFKDYTIYFITITFGISLFYVFNSIESQQAMFEISESQYKIMQTLTQIMGYVSVFVSVILAFLIIYSNQFLIKRRKKELGLYLLLGMEKRKVSHLLVIETLTIGLLSLLLGLVAGVFLSQGLSILTAKMFMVDLTKFTFIFSPTAVVKTIIYFGIVFVVVMLFNTITVSRVNLIDLLYASKKNQTLKLKRLNLAVTLFLVSLGCIGYAYHLIIINGMRELNMTFTMSIILGSVGTLLFFMSLAGFMLKLLQSNKSYYLKGLNMFVLRQINNKVNTNYISMSIICLMLLVAIGTLSTGLGVAQVFNYAIETSAPYDASLLFFPQFPEGGGGARGLREELHEKDLLIDIAEDYAVAPIYKTGLSYDLFLPEGYAPEYLDIASKIPVPAVALSDYNQALQLQGKDPLALTGEQFALFYCSNDSGQYLNDFMSNRPNITLGGNTYQAAFAEAFEVNIENGQLTNNIGTLIFADEVLTNYPIEKIVLNINYLADKERCEVAAQQLSDNWDSKSSYHLGYLNSQQEVREINISLKTIASYIGIYVGLIFMLTSVAVLALQQLSEAADNIERYNLLKKIGADEKMLGNALFKQIAIYFMLPLLLCIVHSIVGISVANKTVSLLGKMNIVGSSLIVAVFIVVFYGGYFLATYWGSKSMLKLNR